jgi:hypothetical protein
LIAHGRHVDKLMSGEHPNLDEEAGAPEGHRDEAGFGEAAKALAGAGACSSGSLAQVQAGRLIEWATARSLLIREAEFELLPLVCDETGEHEVRFRESDQRLLKKTWPGTFGMVPEWSPEGWKPAAATPFEYLDRFLLHNDLFDDDVRLEGVIVSARPVGLVGALEQGVSILISQRWLVAADPNSPHPTLFEISSYMAERGFESLPDSFFGWFRESDGILVLDAKPDNFIKTPDGILPFDLVLFRCANDAP